MQIKATGVRKGDEFVVILSWGEKGGNVSSVKIPLKALHAFFSIPGESDHLREPR